MDKCLSENYVFDSKRLAIPVMVGDKPILAVRLQDLIMHEEATNLRKYADLLFKDVDDKRRKKVAKIKNKAAVKIICKRMGFKQFRMGDKSFTLSSFCPEILVVRWVKDKYLSSIDFDELLGKQYIGNENEQYITYVVAVNPPSSHTTLTIRDDHDRQNFQTENSSDQPRSTDNKSIDFADIVLQERISMFYHSGSLKLTEVMGQERTHFYFRVKYMS